MISAIDQLIITNCPRTALDNHEEIIVNDIVISDIRNIMESYLIEDFSEAPLSEIKQAIRDAFMIRQISTQQNIDINTSVRNYFSKTGA